MQSLSIVICTFNRSRILQELIKYFDDSILIPHGFTYELLFVDNNSSDSTKDVITSLLSGKRSYFLRYLHEEKSGLANARNKGIREAKYNKILFLDDDIIPDRNILLSLNNAFVSLPSLECFAIKVINHAVNAPHWYRLGGRYGMLARGNYDLGGESRFLTDTDPLPIGSGMIISKNIFNEVGLFDPRFGYDLKKSMYIPGEETELFMKIKSHGYRIVYIHDAIINHYPEKEKYDLDTLCKTYMGIGYWYGSADARKVKTGKIITWGGYPRAYYKRFFLDFIPYLLSRPLINKTVRNYYLFQMKRTVGLFKGYRDFRNI